MKYSDPDTLRSHAQQLRHEELARIVHEAAIKWSTFWKANHVPHPCQVSSPPHP